MATDSMQNGTSYDTTSGSTLLPSNGTGSSGSSSATNGSKAPSASSVASSGTGANPSSATGAGSSASAEASSSQPGKSGAKGSTEGKKHRPERYNPSKVEAHAAKKLKRAEGNDDPQVQADVAAVNTGLAVLRPAAADIAYLTDRRVKAELALNQAEANLWTVLLPVESWLRVFEGGRKFVADCQKSTHLATAKLLQQGLPDSGYTLPANLMQALTAQVQVTQAAKDAYDQVEASRVEAGKQYVRAKAQTNAALSMLSASLRRTAAKGRTAALPKPASPSIPKVS